MQEISQEKEIFAIHRHNSVRPDRKFWRNRTGLWSFWPKPDRNRMTSLKKLTGFDRIGRIFIFKNNNQLTSHKHK